MIVYAGKTEIQPWAESRPGRKSALVHLGHRQLDSGQKVDLSCQGASSIGGADSATPIKWVLWMKTQNLARNSYLDFPQEPIDFLQWFKGRNSA